VAEHQNTLGDVIDILSQMLKDLNTQGEEDKENWSAYQAFSDKAETDKQSFLQEQNAFVMSTTAKLKANEQMVQRFTEDIGGLADDISQTKASLRELKQMRKAEHQQFQATLADLQKTIQAVAKASEIMEGHYQGQGALLNQIKARVQIAISMYARRLNPEEKRAASSLLSLIQSGDPDFLNVKGDEKYGSYESNQGGVLGLLDNLHTQLNEQEKALTNKESEARTQFETTRDGKEDDLNHMKNLKTDKELKKEESQAIIKKAHADISQAQKEIKDAKDYLALLLQDRKTFSEENTKRITTRTGELQATQAALDALQAISAGAKSAVAAVLLLQRRKIQRQATGQKGTSVALQALQTQRYQRLRSTFTSLVTLGKKMQNKALVVAASRALQGGAMNPDSMEPVKRLLSDLIDRLEAENSAETTQHDWCENEKETGARSKAEREKTLKGLKASIESETTTISTLKTGILNLESEISRVESETTEANQIRNTEHEIFVSAKTDHEEVIAAIKSALDALKGQYGLIQQKRRRQSPFEDYSSGSGSAASATEMLQDLQTRYSDALKGLEDTEKAAQEAHADLVARNDLFIADTTNARDSDIAQRRTTLNDLADDKSEVKTNMLELHQVAKYLQDLRPSCDDIRSTFEERSKRRGAEIDALKEALEVLEDPTAMDV